MTSQCVSIVCVYYLRTTGMLSTANTREISLKIERDSSSKAL